MSDVQAAGAPTILLDHSRVNVWQLEQLTAATVVGVGAHPDDLELGMLAFILPCITSGTESFVGVTCTDGADAHRGLGYEHLDEAAYVALRQDEQLAAARLGGYGAQIQLGHRERHVTDGTALEALVDELTSVLREATPHTVVTHSLTDRHPHHRRVGLATIAACRDLDARPARVLGVEIWGGLEWLQPHVVALEAPDPDGLGERLASCHASQMSHTPYASAIAARRFANGTYDLSRVIGERRDVTYAMDLTPLLDDPTLTAHAYVQELIASATGPLLKRLELDERAVQ